MMSNGDKLNLELQKTSIGAINAYCRVLEVHIKAVEQGASPLAKGNLGEAVTVASGELLKEVKLLRFLRSAGTDEGSPKASLED